MKLNPTEKLERKKSISFSFRWEWTWILCWFWPEKEFVFIQKVCNSILSMAEADLGSSPRCCVAPWVGFGTLGCSWAVPPTRGPAEGMFLCSLPVFYVFSSLSRSWNKAQPRFLGAPISLTQTAESDFEHEGLPELCSSLCIQTCRNLWWIADDCSFGRTGLASSLISKQLLMIIFCSVNIPQCFWDDRGLVPLSQPELGQTCDTPPSHTPPELLGEINAASIALQFRAVIPGWPMAPGVCWTERQILSFRDSDLSFPCK